MSAENQPAPDTFWAEAEFLGRAALAQLEYFEALGVTGLPVEIPLPAAARSPERPAPAPNKPAAAGAERRSSRPTSPPPEKPAAESAPRLWAPKCPSLADLAEGAARCRACAFAAEAPQLGRGSASPLIALVGSDPSMFEGEKAVLLSGIIEKGLKLSPPEYYVTSLTRCLPPDGGGDERSEAVCAPIVLRELALLRPKVVLALGSGPGRHLSGSADPVGLLRARTHLIDGLEGAFLRVTFGLGHMVSAPEIKKEAWKDIQKIIPGLDKLKQV
ncbi:MAG: hypothetical protein LBV79_10825 [Candidatus Adiutrix sp.]|nr:hypothetical protein [Candidatus Adiutrix sp.]